MSVHSSGVCCDHVEGGMYIGPEFQLGQVYDGGGDGTNTEPVLLYRPVYICIPNPMITITPSAKKKKMGLDSRGSRSFLTKLDSSVGLTCHPGRARNNSGNTSSSISGVDAAGGIKERPKDLYAKMNHQGENSCADSNASSRNRNNKDTLDLTDIKLDNSKLDRGSKSTKEQHNRNSF